MTAVSETSQVYSDIGQNRLYIILRGTISKAEITTIYTDIRFNVADLQPGFSVITEMSSARIGQLAGVPTFKKIADFLTASEVGTIVRVTGKPNLITKQLRRLTERIQGYTPIYVQTLEEAEQVLAESSGAGAGAGEPGDGAAFGG